MRSNFCVVGVPLAASLMLLLNLVTSVGCSDTSTPVSNTPSTQPPTPVAETPVDPGEGGSANERIVLEAAIKMADLSLRGDVRGIRELSARTVLPNYGNWFAQTFGDVMGARLAAEYRPYADNPDLTETMQFVTNRRLTNVAVTTLDKPVNTAGTCLQNYALQRMTRPVPLYMVRFAAPNGSQGTWLWSFVVEGGEARFIGRLRGLRYDVTPNPLLDGLDLMPLAEYQGRIDAGQLPLEALGGEPGETDIIRFMIRQGRLMPFVGG